MDAHSEVFSCVPQESEITWQKEKNLKQGRCDHGVVVFQGEMYVVGGRRGTKSRPVALNSVEVYRKGARGWEWNTIEQMNVARWNHGVAATELQLYAYGGEDVKTVILTAEYYRKDSGRWINIRRKIPRRRCPFYMVVMDGWMYAVGGDDKSTVQRVMPNKAIWHHITDIPEEASGDGRVTVVYNSQLYVLSVTVLHHPCLFRYDPQEKTWWPMNNPQAMGHGVRGVIYNTSRGVIYNTSACISSAASECISRAQYTPAAEGRPTPNRLTGDIQGARRHDSSYQSPWSTSCQTTRSGEPFRNSDFPEKAQPAPSRNPSAQTWRFQASINHDLRSTPLQTSPLSAYDYHQSSEGESSRSFQSSRNLVANQPQNIHYRHSQVPYRENQPVAINQYQQLTVPHTFFQQSSPSNPAETRVVASPQMTNRVSPAGTPARTTRPAVHSPAAFCRRNDGSYSSRSTFLGFPNATDTDPVLDEFIDALELPSDDRAVSSDGKAAPGDDQAVPGDDQSVSGDDKAF